MRIRTIARGVFSAGILAAVTLTPALSVFANEVNTQTDISADITAADTGQSAAAINAATSEKVSTMSGKGTLIEIGNTTAANTTIIVRQAVSGGTTQDLTLEITETTSLVGDIRTKGSLSDWIAGDQLSFTALKFQNSGELIATTIVNTSFKQDHKGINGWITAIRPETNQVDVTWEGKVYTLNVASAKMVAGTKNPAAITDLKVGDRVRGRVTDDKDGNALTWKADILVVLRRGNDLFMRVTRWVVPAKIVNMPEDLTLPTTLEVEVQSSKFYQKGDVNNVIGAPGTRLMVDVVSDTTLARKYLGTALLKEFSEGDSIQVIGKIDPVTGHLVAQYIRDNDIQRLGVSLRFGKVTAIDTNKGTITVMLQNTSRKDTAWTVMVTSATKLSKNGTSISLGNIKVGDTIRVRGTANNATKTVNATTAVVVVGDLDARIKMNFDHLKSLKSFFR